MNLRFFLFFVPHLLCMASALADQTSFGEEKTVGAAWTDNLRWAVDITAQENLDLDADEQLGRYVVGLDLHKVFSNGRRDIGTLILQPYFVWLPDNRTRPAFFDGDEAALTWRIANFNYVVLPRGRLNLRVGHFEVPFGLEQEINTNGTLRQYSNGANLGLKGDWGASLNGQLSTLQYELGLTRGTGQEYFDTGDPYALSGRIGSLPERDLIAGLSVFRGRVHSEAGLIERSRIGADARYLSGPLELMFEISAGEDGEDNVQSWLAEVAWSNSSGTALVYAQQDRIDFTRGRERDTRGTRVGVRWLVTNRLTIAAQVGRTAQWESGRTDSDLALVHVRYRR